MYECLAGQATVHPEVPKGAKENVHRLALLQSTKDEGINPGRMHCLVQITDSVHAHIKSLRGRNHTTVCQKPAIFTCLKN